MIVPFRQDEPCTHDEHSCLAIESALKQVGPHSSLVLSFLSFFVECELPNGAGSEIR
jgi:hypothetical protein